MIDNNLKHTTEYSISPSSGRLRKRTRRRKKSFFSKRKMKKYAEYAMWIILLAAFVYSIIVIFPELGIMSDKKKPGYEKGR